MSGFVCPVDASIKEVRWNLYNHSSGVNTTNFQLFTSDFDDNDASADNNDLTLRSHVNKVDYARETLKIVDQPTGPPTVSAGDMIYPAIHPVSFTGISPIFAGSMTVLLELT